MNNNNRLKSYDDLPLVLDVADIQRIMGISRVSAYELVHTLGFPAFRSGWLIKVSKQAFFDWMEKGSETQNGGWQCSAASILSCADWNATPPRGSMTYVMDKSRLSIRFLTPYREERKAAAGAYAKEHGFQILIPEQESA